MEEGDGGRKGEKTSSSVVGFHTHPLQLDEELVLLLNQLCLHFFHLLPSLLFLHDLLPQLIQLFLLLPEFVLCPGYIQQRLHLRVKTPPLPVAQEEVLADVALQHRNGNPGREIEGRDKERTRVKDEGKN